MRGFAGSAVLFFKYCVLEKKSEEAEPLVKGTGAELASAPPPLPRPPSHGCGSLFQKELDRCYMRGCFEEYGLVETTSEFPVNAEEKNISAVCWHLQPKQVVGWIFHSPFWCLGATLRLRVCVLADMKCGDSSHQVPQATRPLSTWWNNLYWKALGIWEETRNIDFVLPSCLKFILCGYYFGSKIHASD